MIALDAAFLIAHLNAADAHHQAASDLLEEHADQELVIGPVNLAETLVAATRSGHLPATQQAIGRLGVREVPLPPDAAARLAELRVGSGCKMPDCCVLLTAQQESAAIATFDERLKRSAEALAIPIL